MKLILTLNYYFVLGDSVIDFTILDDDDGIIIYSYWERYDSVLKSLPRMEKRI